MSKEGDGIHSQLKEIESRMNRTNQISDSMKKAEDELENRLQEIAAGGGDAQSDETTRALRSKMQGMKQEYDDIMKDSPSLSPSQLTGTGQSTMSSPTKRTPRRQKNNQKTNDVEFATGLSEGLLAQCRQLQALVNDRDKKIKDLESDQDALRSKSTSLESQVTSMSESEERFKDENWGLELQIQDLRKELSKYTEDLTKVTHESSKLEKDKNTHMETIESLKEREVQLREEIAALKTKHDAENIAHEKEQEGLKAENTALHSNVSELRGELDSRPTLAPPTADLQPRGGDFDATMEEEGFDTPENSPPVSPIKATPSRNSALEVETVKSSLGHAHRMVTNLRKNLQRERTEKAELERMLADAREEIQGNGPSLKSKRSRHLAKPATGVGLGSGSRKIKTRVQPDQQDEGDGPLSANDGWEEETASESEFQSALESAADEPTDDNYHTGLETMDEDSDGQNTETEESAGPRFGMDITSSSDEGETPRDKRRRNSRYRRSHFNLRGAADSTETTPIKSQSLASEFMSVDDVEQHAAEHGLITMSVEEHDELVAKADASALPSTREDLETAAAALELEVVSNKELVELKKEAEKTKTSDSLKTAAAVFGLVAIGKDQLAKLRSDHDASVKELDQAKETHQGVLTQMQSIESDHEKLVGEHGELTKTHDGLMQKYDELSKEHARDLTADELATRATQIGHVAIKHDEYFDLVRKRDSPTLEEIRANAEAQNHVMVESSDHDRLVQLAHKPTVDDIKTKAESLGLAVTDIANFKDLKRRAETPSADEVKQHGGKLALAVVGQNEYNQLQTRANEPELDHVKEKAKGYQSVVVPQDEYELLVSQVNEPELGHVQAKAKGLNHRVISNDEHDELVKRANEPDESHVTAKAMALGLVALGASEHKNLLRAADNPTREEVTEKAKAHNLVTMDKDSYHEMKRSADTPSVEEIKAKAQSHKHCVIEAGEYDELVKRANEPSIDQLEAHAVKNDLVVIPKEQVERLHNPTAEDVEKAAAMHGLVAVPVAKYQDIKDAAEAPPTKSWVESAAVTLGLAVLGKDELAKLKQPPPEPSLQDAEAICAKNDCVVVGKKELSKLESPDAKTTAKHAKQHGHVMIPVKEHQELIKPYEPTRDEVEAHAEEFGLVAVPEDDYRRLATELTKDQIVEKAAGFGLVTIAAKEHDELVSRPTEYSPSKEEVSSHATKHGLAVLPVDDHKQLVKQAAEPSREVLDATATKNGLVVMPVTDHEEMKRKVSSPTKDELLYWATQGGFTLLSIGDLQELNNKAAEPSEESVLASASRLKLEMLPVGEYSELTRRADHPTVDEVKKHALGHALDARPVGDWEQLERKADQPTVGELTLACEALDLVAVPKTEYEQLEKSAEEPERELINKHAVRMGLTLLGASELEELRRKANSPTKEDLEQVAGKHGCVVVAKDQYAVLADKADRMDKSGANSNNNGLMMSSVAAKRDHFENVIKQSKGGNSDKIVESMKSLGYVPVASDEYKRLVEGQQAFEPSKREVLKHVKNLGMVAITAEEYKSMVKRNGHTSNTSVSSDVLLMDDSPNSGSPRTPKLGPEYSPSKGSPAAGGLDMQSVPAEYLSSLRRIAENPTKDDVERLAGKLDLQLAASQDAVEQDNKVLVDRAEWADLQKPLDQRVKEFGFAMVDEQEYEQLQRDRQLSAGELKQAAEKIGFVAIAAGEFDQLQAQRRTSVSSHGSMSTHEIQQHADHAGLRAIPVAEYEGLKSQDQTNTKHQITEDELASHAKDFGLILLSSNEFRRLSNPTPAPKTPPQKQITMDDVKAEAKKNGFVVVPESSTTNEAATLREAARGSPVVINNNRHQVQSAVLEDAASEYSDDRRSSYLPSVVEDGVARNMSNASSAHQAPGTGTGLMEAPMLSVNNSPAVSGGHVSTATITTAASMNEKNMIPYVTQVMIGEFLFKYTRRMGVSGISGTRHERYFWVHPYSMSLYWSKENPAMESNHSSKTRGVAILSVKSVDDHNPLPPGLYHKSLMIETNDRTVKITCPTRQRHNIWYNALQFLLKRSADDLVLDEEDELYGEATDDAEDVEFQRERARTLSTPNPRNNKGKVLSLRRSLAPEMNNTRTSRQPSTSSFRPGGRRTPS